MKKILSAVICVAAVTLAACGDDGATGLTEASGTLYQTEVAVDGPLSFALAWYPNIDQDHGVPQVIVEHVTAKAGVDALEGQYAVDLPASPPEDALQFPAPDESPTRLALGIVIAYRDLNGNSKLDTIPAGGSPIDQVVGASVRSPVKSTSGSLVAFLDGPQFGKMTGVWSQGYNIADYETLAPRNGAGLDIVLDADPSLNFMLCETRVPDADYTEATPCGK